MSAKKVIVGVAIFLVVVISLGTPSNKNNTNTQTPNPTSTETTDIKGLFTNESDKKEEVKKCEDGKELSRACSSCNKAMVTYLKFDCTEFTQEKTDESCSSLCPVETTPEPVPQVVQTPQPAPIVQPIPTPQPAPQPTPAPQPAPVPQQPQFACNCSKTCTQMISCAEAYYQLNTCGCSKRDDDNDGVPCESICQ